MYGKSSRLAKLCSFSLFFLAFADLGNSCWPEVLYSKDLFFILLNAKAEHMLFPL
jgi:cytochrome bd-type quinol oxidase subunit 2